MIRGPRSARPAQTRHHLARSGCGANQNVICGDLLWGTVPIKSEFVIPWLVCQCSGIRARGEGVGTLSATSSSNADLHPSVNPDRGVFDSGGGDATMRRRAHLRGSVAPADLTARCHSAAGRLVFIPPSQQRTHRASDTRPGAPVADRPTARRPPRTHQRRHKAGVRCHAGMTSPLRSAGRRQTERSGQVGLWFSWCCSRPRLI